MSESAEFTKEQMHFDLSLPDWAIQKLSQLPESLPNLDARMEQVIEFSRLNYENETGGPFAAGVFERDSGKIVVIGVNRVVPSNCSTAHAEIMALSLAQKVLRSFDLGGEGMPHYQLVVNWLPCAMCFGALMWSGIKSLAIAGSGPELEEITGFDEGPIHPDWPIELKSRGIELHNNILNDKAIEVFKGFAASGQLVYNGRLGETESI
jgi:tRNA(Arg) A34 adenosine deaminase TadA